MSEGSSGTLRAEGMPACWYGRTNPQDGPPCERPVIAIVPVAFSDQGALFSATCRKHERMLRPVSRGRLRWLHAQASAWFVVGWALALLNLGWAIVNAIQGDVLSTAVSFVAFVIFVGFLAPRMKIDTRIFKTCDERHADGHRCVGKPGHIDDGLRYHYCSCRYSWEP